jgi:hypothetical protein
VEPTRLECQKKEASLGFSLRIRQTIFDATEFGDRGQPQKAKHHANKLRSESLRV